MGSAMRFFCFHVDPAASVEEVQIFQELCFQGFVFHGRPFFLISLDSINQKRVL